MNMEHFNPGSGGRHRQTLSYGLGPDLSLSPRQALARDIMDVRRIYQGDGLYKPNIRAALRDVISRSKQAFPGTFAKGGCK